MTIETNTNFDRIQEINQSSNFFDGTDQKILSKKGILVNGQKETFIDNINKNFDIRLERTLLENSNIIPKSDNNPFETIPENLEINPDQVNRDLLNNRESSLTQFRQDYVDWLNKNYDNLGKQEINLGTYYITIEDLIKNKQSLQELRSQVSMSNIVIMSDADRLARLAELEAKIKDIFMDIIQTPSTSKIDIFQFAQNYIKQNVLKPQQLEELENIMDEMKEHIGILDDNNDMSHYQNSLNIMGLAYQNQVKKLSNNIPQQIYGLSMITDPNKFVAGLKSILNQPNISRISNSENTIIINMFDQLDFSGMTAADQKTLVSEFSEIFSDPKRYQDHPSINYSLHTFQKDKYRQGTNFDDAKTLENKFPIDLIDAFYNINANTLLQQVSYNPQDTDTIENILELSQQYRSLMQTEGVLDKISTLTIQDKLDGRLDVEILTNLMETTGISDKIIGGAVDKISDAKTEIASYSSLEQYFQTKNYSGLFLDGLGLGNLIHSNRNYNELEGREKLALEVFFQTDQELNGQIDLSTKTILQGDQDKNIANRDLFVTTFTEKGEKIFKQLNRKFTQNNLDDFGLTAQEKNIASSYLNLLNNQTFKKTAIEQLQQNGDPTMQESGFKTRFKLGKYLLVFAAGAFAMRGIQKLLKPQPHVEVETREEPTIENIQEAMEFISLKGDFTHGGTYTVEQFTLRNPDLNTIELLKKILTGILDGSITIGQGMAEGADIIRKLINLFQNKEVSIQIEGKFFVSYNLASLKQNQISVDENGVLHITDVPYPTVIPGNLVISVLDEDNELIQLNRPEFQNAIGILTDILQNEVVSQIQNSDDLLSQAEASFSEGLLKLYNLSPNLNDDQKYTGITVTFKRDDDIIPYEPINNNNGETEIEWHRYNDDN